MTFSEIVVSELQHRAAELAVKLGDLERRKESASAALTYEEKDGQHYGYFLDLSGDICETRARLSIYRNSEMYTPESLPTLRRYYEHRRDIACEIIDAFYEGDGAAEFRRVKENFVIKEVERALDMLDGLDKMNAAALASEGLERLAAATSVKE